MYWRIFKTESYEPNLESGNIYIAESTVQLMVWGVVYDFMSFCTNLYGKNYEGSEISIADSRIQLTSDIAEYRPSDFHFSKLQHFFLSIAGCANGILANAYILKMIYNPDEDSEEEDDMHGGNESDDSNDESDADSDATNEPPTQKRQCNRMTVFNQSK